MIDHIHVIACGVLAIDLKDIARRMGAEATMQFLPGGLHASPHELRQRLQESIDSASTTSGTDRIVVGYGVCGLGAVGIHARNVPLAIPRVNDCIALFLGSDAAYRREFARYPGTYYISAGWVEEKTQPPANSAGGDAPIHCGPECFTYRQLVEKYGEENAEAIRRFLTSWQRNYQRAAFIDTGVEGKGRRYADLAKAMADQFGWTYEELRGSGELLAKLLVARHSTEEVLLVPPHHVTVFDGVTRRLAAVPIWQRGEGATSQDHTLVFDSPEAGPADRSARLGLGIDAGGTYTDAVLFDFTTNAVLEKAKALTTKWDFTIGIGQALGRLSPARLATVDLVAISTTLATNAIVEGRGQKVGLLVMPPYGLWKDSHIAYRPIALLEGKMEIDGRPLAPVNPQQVRQVVREMVRREQVGAFAVAGYASHANPAHELEVRAIVREECGLSVTCGHEVSEQLNYRVRAVTAALNASIIPCLEAFLNDVEAALRGRGIAAPKMVVKSDGSLMSLAVARQRPIETILSGPAASVAGASYLAGLSEAMVVDMGGTTTDTAMIRRGAVRTCDQGATVGGWRTHVRALDMRTLGLGGDSLIARDKDGQLRIGPLRVAPVAWLFDGASSLPALDWLARRLDRFRDTTRGMDLVALTGPDVAGLPSVVAGLRPSHGPDRRSPCNGGTSDPVLPSVPEARSEQETSGRAFRRGQETRAEPEETRAELAAAADLSPDELRLLDALSAGPMSVDELTLRLDARHWQFLPLDRLERLHLVQRSALTPTDVLHAAGQVELWSAEAARRVVDLFCRLLGASREEFTRRIVEKIVRRLALELLKKQLADETDPELLEQSHAATTMLDNWLAGDRDGYQVRIVLKRPVVGIGAPVHLFLPEAARLLETEAVIPPHADVANAIGAITSGVLIQKQVELAPGDNGRYYLAGLPGAPSFADFHEAQAFALAELQNLVRGQAREAGTSQGRVEIAVHDHLAPSAFGDMVFLGRTLTARLSGRPDLAQLEK